MKLPAFEDAHIVGYHGDTWLKKAGVWLLYTTVWTPVCFYSGKLYGRVTNSSKSFIARNVFHGTTRHWYCFGSTDWGKSSLLKEAVADLMPDILAGKASGFIMDGTELCDEILAKLNLTPAQIKKHVILIDLRKPGGTRDIGCLPRFNMMETSDGSTREDEFVERTARISVFSMLFDGLMSAENTAPMKSMMALAAQTMAYVDDPSLDDLKELFRAPRAFIDRLPDLEKSIRDDWEDQVKLKEIKDRQGNVIDTEEIPNETAGALLRRVATVTNNPIINRLLANSVPTVNLAHRLNQGGCLVLVATRKGKVMPDGARLAGRFMLSMLLRAVGARDSLSSPVKTFVAIDEFPNYLIKGMDEALLNLLAEARKHRVSIWLLNQEERQLAPNMLSALLTNCHVITAGGMSQTMAASVRDKIGIVAIDSGPKKGEPNIDLMKLKPKHFAAGVRGKKPCVLVTKRDPLGDQFRRIPGGEKGERMVKKTMDDTLQIMRELYAEDPVVRMRKQAAEAAEFQEPELV